MSKNILLIATLFVVGCATQPSNKAHLSKAYLTKAYLTNAHMMRGHLTSGQILKIKTTAYTQSEKGGGRNAIGRRLSKNSEKSASADWAQFPLGTKFQIVGSNDIYRVDDYGSALIRKQTIDLYKPSRISMRNWGVRYVDIKILEWGSPQMSLQVLLPRSRNPHVRTMISDLREQI